MLPFAHGEEVSSVRPAYNFRNGAMDDISEHLWISKSPVYTCLDTLEKEIRIFIQENFLRVCFNFKSFCSVLFRNNTQTHCL